MHYSIAAVLCCLATSVFAHRSAEFQSCKQIFEGKYYNSNGKPRNCDYNEHCPDSYVLTEGFDADKFFPFITPHDDHPQSCDNWHIKDCYQVTNTDDGGIEYFVQQNLTTYIEGKTEVLDIVQIVCNPEYKNCFSYGCDAIDFVPVPPTPEPTSSPTKAPSTSPTKAPTSSPTKAPSTSPTKAPTTSPTKAPTSSPTKAPTSSPTKAPSTSPTKAPSTSPTTSPSKGPTISPTESPSTSPTISPTICSEVQDIEIPVDVVFLLDQSKSVKTKNYERLKKFLRDMANEYLFGPESTRMGVVEFATGVGDSHDITDDREEFISAVNSLKYNKGCTHTATALQYMDFYFSRLENTRRLEPVPSRQVLILATDGNPTTCQGGRGNNKKNTRKAAIALKDKYPGMELLYVPIGRKPNKKLFNKIANYVLPISSFTKFSDFLSEFVSIVSCEEMSGRALDWNPDYTYDDDGFI